MRETSKIMLGLLDELIPVVQRNIDALQHNPNPLLQHLVQQEIERQEDLLQRIEAMKERLNGYLNPREDVPQPEDVPEQDEVENDLQQEDSEPGDSEDNVLYIS